MNTRTLLVTLALATLAAPAFARSDGPMHVTMQVQDMPDGALLMQVEMPQSDYFSMGRSMKANHTTCKVTEIDNGPIVKMDLICMIN